MTSRTGDRGSCSLMLGPEMAARGMSGSSGIMRGSTKMVSSRVTMAVGRNTIVSFHMLSISPVQP